MQIHMINHRLGRRVMFKDGKKGCIMIPRNASSTLLTTAHKHGHEINNSMYEKDLNIHFLVIVREPWDRYLSGLYQSLRVKKWTTHTPNAPGTHPKEAFYWEPPYEKWYKLSYIYDTLFVKRRELPRSYFKAYEKYTSKHTLIFDEHTLPQYIMFQPFIGSNLKWIRYGPDLTDALAEWFGASRIFNNNITANIYPLHKEFRAYFEEKLKEDKEWYAAWQELFKEDYWIWENLTIREADEYEDILKQCRKLPQL